MKQSQQQALFAELELVKELATLSPEERRAEARRQVSVQLRAIETERRRRAASEAEEKWEKEREEKDKAAEHREKCLLERRRHAALEREMEERRTDSLKAMEKEEQLKRERVHWGKDEKLDKRPGCTTVSALTEEQHTGCTTVSALTEGQQTSDLKAKDKGRKKTLHNNWVEEPKNKSDGETVEEKRVDPSSATYLLFAAQSAAFTETPKSKMGKKWKVKMGSLLDKYQEHRERKEEKRSVKAEAQHAKFRAFKASRGRQYSRQYDNYTAGFSAGRNSILKSIF